MLEVIRASRRRRPISRSIKSGSCFIARPFIKPPLVERGPARSWPLGSRSQRDPGSPLRGWKSVARCDRSRPVEPVVQAELDDVESLRDVESDGVADSGDADVICRYEALGPKIVVSVFGERCPTRRERPCPFETAAYRPPRPGLRSLAERLAEQCVAHVPAVVHPGSAALHVDKSVIEEERTVIQHKAEAPGHARDPINLDVVEVVPVPINQDGVQRVDVLAVNVGTRKGALDADHPVAGELVVAADLTPIECSARVDLS